MKSPIYFDKYYSQYNIIKLIFNILKPIKSYLLLSVLLVLLTAVSTKEKFEVKIIGPFDRARLATGDSLINDQIFHRLMFPPEFWQNKASGVVEISFDVKNDSTIENITIEKDLFAGCNKYLIQNLQQLKWKNTDNPKGNHIVLQFHLDHKIFNIAKFSNLEPELKDSTISLEDWSNQLLKTRSTGIKDSGLVVGMILTDSNGNITERKIVLGLSTEADSIAASILNEIPPLTPGIAHGEKVNSGRFIEFKFNLNDDKVIYNNEKFYKSDIYKQYCKEAKFFSNEAAIYNYINKVRYPEYAIENNIQGTVILSGFVEYDGTISFIYVNKNAHKVLTDVSYNHIKNMPDWLCGANRFNIPKRFYISIPIKFKIQ